MKPTRYLASFLALFLAVIVCPTFSSAASWPPGAITKTVTTAARNCEQYQDAVSVGTYSNWNYRDSSGVNHAFIGTTQQVIGESAQCTGNEYPTTSFVATDGAYTLTAIGSTATMTITAFVLPKYQILSLIYAPPGNSSSNGFTDSVFNGTTNSITNSFSTGITTTFSATGGILGVFGGVSTSVSFTQGSGTTNSFTDTITNAQGLTLKSNRNPIDHTQDQFWLWLNPQVTITQTGPSAATYTVSPPSGQNMYALLVSVAALKTPSLIPLDLLEPITSDGVIYPGLSNICAHPLPPPDCTKTNACGCVPSDFAAIVATDPLVSLTSDESPAQIDSKRFFPLNPSPEPIPFLEGPTTPNGVDTTEAFALTDMEQTSQQQTESTTYSTSFTYSNGIGGTEGVPPVDWSLKWSVTNTFTWQQIVGLTNTTGTSHQMSLVLGSSTYGCNEAVDIYEDYDYHTFVGVPSSTPPAPCNSN
jgi:hypothetical protein